MDDLSIKEKIIKLFTEPQIKYKGIPVNIIGIPIFKKYKRNSVYSAVSRLKKDKYIFEDNGYYKLSPTYKINKKFHLLKFESSRGKGEPKNLIVMFDIPENKKVERNWFRFHLKKFHYIMVQKSVWVGPSPLPKEFSNYVKEIGLKECIKTFKLASPYKFSK